MSSVAVGSVVKCSFEFPAETENDLHIFPGDLIKITKVVNQQWYEGISNGKKGQFPSAFVERSTEMFDVGIAISSFEAQQDGDLALLQGEFVVITERIDDSWYSGYTHGGNKGMFPSNFIQPIEFGDTVASNTVVSSENDSNVVSSLAPVNDKQTEIDWVEVIENFQPQDDNELELFKGMKVEILSHVDEFWCEGRSGDGRQGIFPKSFVNLNNSNIHSEGVSSEQQDGPVVSYEESGPPPPIQKAKALFTFAGAETGDLSFCAGDEIFIVEKIDAAWFRGQLGTDIGIFPSNYVEIVETVSPMPVHVPPPQTKSILTTAPPQATTTTKKKPPGRPGKPPGRPKPPVIKKQANDVSKSKYIEETKTDTSKDQTPFQYAFTTNSQPNVIIPSKYAKAGHPNIVVFKKNQDQVSFSSPGSSYNSSVENSPRNLYTAPQKQDVQNVTDNQTYQQTKSYVTDQTQKMKTKGSVINNEFKSINKHIPAEDASTFQKLKCANSNLDSVVKISNEVGIKTTKKEVLKGAVKLGAAGYLTGSKSNKPAPPVKSAFLKGKFP